MKHPSSTVAENEVELLDVEPPVLDVEGIDEGGRAAHNGISLEAPTLHARVTH